MIPLRFFANRTRAVANFTSLFSTSAFFSWVFLMTLFEQQVLHYSPLKGGLGYLPLGVAIGAGIGIGTALMPRLGVRPLWAATFFGAAIGLLMNSRCTGQLVLGDVLPGMIVLAFPSGWGCPGHECVASRVTGQDSSLASGVQGTMQQVGGALGLAGLATLALRHAATQVSHGVAPQLAAVHGYVLAFRIGAAMLVIGGVLVLVLLERVSTEARNPLAEVGIEPSVASPSEALASPARA